MPNDPSPANEDNMQSRKSQNEQQMIPPDQNQIKRTMWADSDQMISIHYLWMMSRELPWNSEISQDAINRERLARYVAEWIREFEKLESARSQSLGLGPSMGLVAAGECDRILRGCPSYQSPEEYWPISK